MILRGILARSFENILCLRGFAPLGVLEELSFPDENYQREEIESHSKDIADYLESGEYTFFPEVILGGSLRKLGFSDEDIDALYQSVDQGEAFKLKNIGDISVSTFVKKFKIKNGMKYDIHVTGSFYKLKEGLFSRIDGNHRLQAVNQSSEKVRRYQAPFCLALFRTDEEQQRFGRVFFHMINFRSVPISEEQNLKLILEEQDYSDETLQAPPFGTAYVLARKCLRDNVFQEIKDVQLSRTALLKLMRYLIELDKKSDKSAETSNNLDKGEEIHERTERIFKKIKTRVDALTSILNENIELRGFCSQNENIFAALLTVSFRDMSKYSEFMVWLQNCCRDDNFVSLDVPFDEVIKRFDVEREKRERTIFVSMQFGSCGTEQNYKTIKKVVNAINSDYNLSPQLEIERIDQPPKGETFEINESIIKKVAQCGYLIADLTYCNSNVYHEIGMLMGRTLALTGKHEYNMALILDNQVSQENKIVKFNLQSLQHFAFSTQEELTDGIRDRIEKFYRLK